MGILKGALTFSRYAVRDDLPERFLEFAHQRLVRGAFSGLQTTQRQKTMGWIGLEDILDTGFNQGRHIKGDYLLFSLRVDRKAIPASLLKVETMAAERQYLQETGKDRLYREQKQDIRDRIQLSLLEQSLAVPAFYDICWSLSAKWLIFTSLAENACLDFQEMFKESFGFIPSPWVPWGNVDITAKNDDPALTPIKEETIGREFLTWLWFKSEERGGAIALPKRGEIEVNFLRRLVLEAGDGINSETVTCNGANTDLKEGKEALRQGKKIKEGRIRLRIDADAWEFTLKADTFNFQTLKLPETVEMADEKDVEGRSLERIYLIERVIGTMDDLFALFMEIRQSAAWVNDEQPRMKKWMQA